MGCITNKKFPFGLSSCSTFLETWVVPSCAVIWSRVLTIVSPSPCWAPVALCTLSHGWPFWSYPVPFCEQFSSPVFLNRIHYRDCISECIELTIRSIESHPWRHWYFFLLSVQMLLCSLRLFMDSIVVYLMFSNRKTKCIYLWNFESHVLLQLFCKLETFMLDKLEITDNIAARVTYIIMYEALIFVHVEFWTF